MRYAARTFFLRDVVHDNDEVSGHALAVRSHDPVSGEDARIAVRHLDFIVGRIGPQFVCQRLVVGCVNTLGIFRSVDFEQLFFPAPRFAGP